MKRWLIRCGMLVLLALAGGAGLRVGAADEAPYPERLAALQKRLAGQPTNAVVLFELGRLCHWQGTLGSSDAVKLADQYLRQLCRLEPTNTFGRSLLGSTIILEARDAFPPTTKLKLVRQGLAEMDAALAAAPDDHNARFTRASNNMFLPAFLKRQAIVRADFGWLTEQTTTHADRYPEDFRQYVALFHGMARKKFGEPEAAKKLWEDGIRINPRSPIADSMRHELEKKGE